MSGALLLALRHARHHAFRTVLLILCVAAAAFVPMATRVLVTDFQSRLLARAAQTPILVGAPGNRFDLTITALYFRKTPVETLPLHEFHTLLEASTGTAIPLHARFTARGLPIVATTPEYFALRHLAPATGTLPLQLGDACLGAAAARRLGMSSPDAIGGEIFSDTPQGYDLASAGAIRLRVAGVLAPSGTPDDDAIFTALETAWILEGRSHAHGDPARDIPDSLLLSKDPGGPGGQGGVSVSESLVEDNAVTDRNVRAFHLHGDERSLPLTAIIVVPDSPRSGSLLRARLSGARPSEATSPRAIVPAEVVEEILRHILRVQALINGLSVVLIALAFAVLGLVTTLSARIRVREFDTLTRIGASRFVVGAILGWEVMLVILAGVSIALVAAAVLAAIPPDLANLL